VHLDESCLGNGRPGENPGGAAALIEVRVRGAIERRDLFLHAPDTTNNRMALAGAIATLQLLGQKGRRLRVVMVSDSEYLVRGVREWLPGWVARDWKRKSGPIENLELWRSLRKSLDMHEVQLTWVRGHAGHPKNEYANDLAMRAAETGATSPGLDPSGFDAWLAAKQARGTFAGYDPDRAFDALASRIDSGRPLALAEEA